MFQIDKIEPILSKKKRLRHHTGKVNIQSNTAFLNSNRIQIASYWNFAELFTLEQIQLNNVISCAKVKRLYDLIREREPDFKLSERSENAVKRKMKIIQRK